MSKTGADYLKSIDDGRAIYLNGGRVEDPVNHPAFRNAAKAVYLETSCEQGICGTCLTGVWEGVPDHRDLFLTEDEKKACDQLTPCVPHAHSERLILDL